MARLSSSVILTPTSRITRLISLGSMCPSPSLSVVARCTRSSSQGRRADDALLGAGGARLRDASGGGGGRGHAPNFLKDECISTSCDGDSSGSQGLLSSTCETATGSTIPQVSTGRWQPRGLAITQLAAAAAAARTRRLVVVLQDVGDTGIVSLFHNVLRRHLDGVRVLAVAETHRMGPRWSDRQGAAVLQPGLRRLAGQEPSRSRSSPVTCAGGTRASAVGRPLQGRAAADERTEEAVPSRSTRALCRASSVKQLSGCGKGPTAAPSWRRRNLPA